MPVGKPTGSFLCKYHFNSNTFVIGFFNARAASLAERYELILRKGSASLMRRLILLVTFLIKKKSNACSAPREAIVRGDRVKRA